MRSAAVPRAGERVQRGCAIDAPRYRQLTFSAIFHYNENSRGAEDLAYSDVKRAFEYYIAHYNHGRPFIIASHSQGSRMAVRLIPELIDGTPLRNQLVAAHIVGNWITEGWFARQKTIKPCERTYTGCVLTRSTPPKGRTRRSSAWTLSRATDFRLPWPPSGSYAPIRFPGCTWPGQSTQLRPLDPSVVGARCDDGALFISDPAPATYRAAGHNHDYQLFWMNVRQNEIDRVHT